jgi:parallel beta-helix repeat protein
MTYRQLVAIGTALAIPIALAVPLAAVDGVKLINQSKAMAGGVTPGDEPGFPVTISRPGTYQLSSNLTVPAGQTGIEITADNVTLNLNGWSIIGTGGGSGDGVFSAGTVNIAVLNGTVWGMGRYGVFLANSSRVEKVRALDNEGGGIFMANSGTVTGNTASQNGGPGITAGGASTVTGNTANFNSSHGIVTSGGTQVISNTAAQNVGAGLNLSFFSGYTHNVLSFNSGGSVIGTGVSLGQNLCDGVVC